MKGGSLYSIGHGNKTLEEFIQELKAFNIEYVIDVRSKPYSKWNPDFNRENLKNELEEKLINYSFKGDALGGRPEDPSCYSFEGKIQYDKLKTKDFFKNGLERLVNANKKNVPVAIMCSESKPTECHRSKLIGRELMNKSISINHIINKSVCKTQEEIIIEINKGVNSVDLFGNEVDYESRKSY